MSQSRLSGPVQGPVFRWQVTWAMDAIVRNCRSVASRQGRVELRARPPAAHTRMQRWVARGAICVRHARGVSPWMRYSATAPMTPALRLSPLKRVSGSTSDTATATALKAGHAPRTVSRQRYSVAPCAPRPSHPERSTSSTVGCIKSTGTLITKLPLLTCSIVLHCVLWQLAVMVDLRCCTCDNAGALHNYPC